jgi:hypothetical protein
MGRRHVLATALTPLFVLLFSSPMVGCLSDLPTPVDGTCTAFPRKVDPSCLPQAPDQCDQDYVNCFAAIPGASCACGAPAPRACPQLDDRCTGQLARLGLEGTCETGSAPKFTDVASCVCGCADDILACDGRGPVVAWVQTGPPTQKTAGILTVRAPTPIRTGGVFVRYRGQLRLNARISAAGSTVLIGAGQPTQINSEWQEEVFMLSPMQPVDASLVILGFAEGTSVGEIDCVVPIRVN